MEGLRPISWDDRQNVSSSQLVAIDAMNKQFDRQREAAIKEVKHRDEQHREMLDALGLQAEIARDQRRQLEEISTANYAVVDAVNQLGARFDWQLDQVREVLGNISGQLDSLVNLMRRPDETRSREKWQDAQNAWLDRRLDRSVELYEEALSIYDALSPASFQLGNLQFFELGNAEAAIKSYQLTNATATRRAPELAALSQYNLHRVYRAQGEFQKAWDAVTEACALSPGLGPAWWDRATLAVTTRKGEKNCTDALLHAISIDPLYWHKGKSEDLWRDYSPSVTKLLSDLMTTALSAYRIELTKAEDYFYQARNQISSIPQELQQKYRGIVGSYDHDLGRIKSSVDESSYPVLLSAQRACSPIADQCHMALLSALKSDIQASLQRVREAQRRYDEHKSKGVFGVGADFAGTMIGWGVLGVVVLIVGIVLMNSGGHSTNATFGQSLMTFFGAIMALASLLGIGCLAIGVIFILLKSPAMLLRSREKHARMTVAQDLLEMEQTRQRQLESTLRGVELLTSAA